MLWDVKAPFWKHLLILPSYSCYNKAYCNRILHVYHLQRSNRCLSSTMQCQNNLFLKIDEKVHATVIVENLSWWTACSSGSGCCLQNKQHIWDKQTEWKEKAKRSKGQYIIICYCHVLTKGIPLQTRHAYKPCQDMNWWVKSYKKPFRIDNYSCHISTVYKSLLQFSTYNSLQHLYMYTYKNNVFVAW